MTDGELTLQVESRTLDAEYVKLLHEVHAQEMPGHIYRGFTVLSKDSTAKLRSIKVRCSLLTSCVVTLQSTCNVISNNKLGIYSIKTTVVPLRKLYIMALSTYN